MQDGNTAARGVLARTSDFHGRDIILGCARAGEAPTLDRV
jgi:hypothetical protein